MFPEIEAVTCASFPFDHLTGRVRLPRDGKDWLDWLETDAPWKLTTAEFYEQYEFSLLDASLPPVVRCLASPETVTTLRFRVSECFRQPLSERVEVTAHKLVPDQTIRIHNDHIAGGESHRLLLQLNRGWEPEKGGYLMFFGGPEPETVSEVIEPIHASVQGFAISARSYHAVSTVHRGERFTLVYSFYPDPGCR